MLQKGPNFKNFRGKNSLLNLRIPAQLGFYAALCISIVYLNPISVGLAISNHLSLLPCNIHKLVGTMIVRSLDALLTKFANPFQHAIRFLHIIMDTWVDR